MNKEDRKILALLKEDGRYGTGRIAEMTGLPEEEVRARIADMEDSGIIAKYTVLVNPEKLDDDAVSALIEVKVTPMMSAGFDAIARSICRFDEVKDLYLMSGGYDLGIIVRGRNLREVSRFVSEKLSVLKDVVSTSTHFILKKYKTEGVVLEKDEVKREEFII